MNSARHANRSSRGHQFDRGRSSGRGRGRDRGREGALRGGFGESFANLAYGPVPTIRQVIVGAPVSIVLKVDQPTGNQVQGTVAELLTRGDHPRGIKVRLEDGRVGRVQKMVSVEEARMGSAGLSGLGRNSEMGIEQSGVGTAAAEPVNTFSRTRYTDFRIDDAEEPEKEELSLADYVVVKEKRKSKGSKANPAGTIEENIRSEDVRDQPVLEPSSMTVTCPVCGNFEGDEAAVVHHVETHFA